MDTGSQEFQQEIYMKQVWYSEMVTPLHFTEFRGKHIQNLSHNCETSYFTLIGKCLWRTKLIQLKV